MPKLTFCSKLVQTSCWLKQILRTKLFQCVRFEYNCEDLRIKNKSLTTHEQRIFVFVQRAQYLDPPINGWVLVSRFLTELK